MGTKKKRHGPGLTPPANAPHGGPPSSSAAEANVRSGSVDQGAGFEQQDPKRRLGNFEGAGEHSFVQPGGKNDANR